MRKQLHNLLHNYLNHKNGLAQFDYFIPTHSSNKNHYIIVFCYESLYFS